MDSHLQQNATRIERGLRRVFTRPWLAALLVGIAIHGFNAMNQWFAGAGSYFASHWLAIRIQPSYGVVQVLIPFLVPWLVTGIGRHLAGISRAAMLAAFPDANPDLVIKLDSDGLPLYANRAVRRWLRELGEPADAIETILPEGYIARLAYEGAAATPLILPFSRDGREIEYVYRREEGGNGVFVAGRDVTSVRHVTHRLETANRRFRRLIEMFDKTLAHFDPLRFERHEHYRRVLGALLRDPDSGPADKPTHLFLAERQADGLTGHIYTRQGDTINEDPEEIHVAPYEKSFAITWGKPEVICANWQESGVSLAQFQERFHPRVREKIGDIEGFATYQSGSVALIAFYQNYTVEPIDALLLKVVAVIGNSLHRVAVATQETEDSFTYTVEALARAAEANDEDTGEHIVRINEYSRLLAETLGMDKEFVRRIHFSAQMHDVGKIHVHPNILKKPGRLTDDEFEAMKSHPLYGAQILGDSKRLKMAAEIARCHHEKYNGTGYPLGLQGEEIPLSARIVALADVYDALRQKRVYKPALSHERAVEIIFWGDDRIDPSDFDPQVLNAFHKTSRQMDEIFNTFQAVEEIEKTG